MRAQTVPERHALTSVGMLSSSAVPPNTKIIIIIIIIIRGTNPNRIYPQVGALSIPYRH